MSFCTRLNIFLPSLTIFLTSATTHAEAFPRGCEVTGFSYTQNYLTLNETGDQTYFLIQNRSDAKVQLERYDETDSFMSPPLQAVLDPTNWAAFASDMKHLNFKCYKTVNENTSLIDCHQVLDVCQYPRAKFALSNMGTYWISTNKNQNDVIQDSVAKGVYLKW